MKCGTSQLPEKVQLLEKSYWQEIEVVSEKESKVNLRKESIPFHHGLGVKELSIFCCGFFLAFFFFFFTYKEINTCFS